MLNPKLFYDFHTNSEEVYEEDEDHNDNAANGKYHIAIFPIVLMILAVAEVALSVIRSYCDPDAMEPFDVARTIAKKSEYDEEESEDEVEINECERLRREGVAWNQKQLKSLGLS